MSLHDVGPLGRETEAAASVPAELPYPRERVAWYLVGVLMSIYVFSYVDRQILSLLVGPMKRDLGLSDTQVSLLMGTSFAVFYSVCGIPLGRLADSRSRRAIIAVGLVLWSAMTAGCGVARHYWQLLLLRMGVGVGEAALGPSAYSMITDSFAPRLLATAISVYSTGIYIGSGLAFVLGGVVIGAVSAGTTLTLPFVGEIRPWQLVFFIVGLPGLLMTLLLFTIREPLRRGAHAQAGREHAALPLSEVVAYLRENWQTIAYHHIGFALLAFASYGISAWIPAFLQRTHAMSARSAGVSYGVIVMLAGTAGIVFGGRLADRLAERGYRDAKLRTGTIAALAGLPFGLLFPLVPSAELALLALIPAAFTTSMPFGCAPAAIQEMMPNPMRGQASALYLFVINLIGLGLGPTAVALCTDYLFGDDAALRYSLLLVTVTAHVAAAALLWAGQRPFRDSLKRLDAWHAARR